MADPDIEIQRPAGHANEIVNNGVDNLGSRPYGVPITLVYTIANVGVEINPAMLPDGEEGVSYSQTITAIGGIGSFSWTISSGSLPTGLSINSNTGEISGTPTTADTYEFTVQVQDSAGHTDTESFSITILDAVQITTATLPDGQIGVAYSEDIVSSGGVAPYFMEASGSIPSGLTFTDNLDGTATISGTPDTAETYVFTVTVTDGLGGTDDQEYTVTIGSADRPGSTRMLTLVHPDDVLDLTGANINAFHEQIEQLVDFTEAFGGAKWTRQTSVLNGYNVAQNGNVGDFVCYRSPNTTDGHISKWIDSDGSNVAATGCLALVFKPTDEDGNAFWAAGTGWFKTGGISGGMKNDSGTYKFAFNVRGTGGGVVTVSVACPLNQWHYAIMRWNTTHIYLSIDGGTESSTAFGGGNEGGATSMNSRMSILGNESNGGWGIGQFAEISIIDPDDRDALATFLEARYGL